MTGPADREEIARAISAGLVLLLIFSLALYYASVSPHESNEAIRLVIRKPSELPKGVEGELTIEAVDKRGVIDRSRDDLVRISLDSAQYAKLGYSDQSRIIWSGQLLIKLEGGQVQVKFVDSQMERVHISAEWVDGKSPLESCVIELYNGWRVS